jgi:hypothetical protein
VPASAKVSLTLGTPYLTFAEEARFVRETWGAGTAAFALAKIFAQQRHSIRELLVGAWIQTTDLTVPNEVK